MDLGIVSVDDDTHPAVHGHGARLVPAHTSQAGAEVDSPNQRAAEVLVADCTQGFKGSLDDTLRADVFPGTGRILGEHSQVFILQVIEDLPGCFHNVGIGHDHPGGQPMSLEYGYRHTGLDDEGFVVLQFHQRSDDGVIALPVAGAFANAAIDHQPLRCLGVFHVVLQHAQQALLFPALAAQGRPTLSLDRKKNLGFHSALLHSLLWFITIVNKLA